MQRESCDLFLYFRHCTRSCLLQLTVDSSVGGHEVEHSGVGGCNDPPGWMDPRSNHPRVFGPGGPSTLG